MTMRIAVAFLLAVLALPAHAADNAVKAPAATIEGGLSGRLPAPFETRTFDEFDQGRFGMRPSDEAFGAYQRGLYLTAHNLAKPLAENGNAAAQALVAELLARGLGVKRDEKEAAKWYKLAAEQGIPEAEFQYALLLLQGALFPRDEKEALRLMRKAADAGNRLALFNAAQMLVQAKPGSAGLAEAEPYFRKAAEAGLADAQYAMSQLILNGAAGLKPDEPEAIRWLTAAAQQNYDTAQLDLGTWLVEGRRGRKDQEAGFKWLKLAASQGNVAAQNRVAKLYMAGVGVPADAVEAAAWYTLARRAGLADREMDDFIDGLADEDRQKALERANRLR